MPLQIVETMPHTPFVENFIEKLGHFYELVDEKGVVKFPASLVDLAQPTLPNGDLPSQSTPRENGGHHFLKSELETDASTGRPHYIPSQPTPVRMEDIIS